MKPTDTEHPRIWLEPKGAPDRCWCSDNQWGDEGVEYILASAAQPPCDHDWFAMVDPARPLTHAIAYCSKCGQDGNGRTVMTPAYNPQPHLMASPCFSHGGTNAGGAPPAPSPAVKALEWIVAHPAESNAVVWDLAKNALSAQVQDVARDLPSEFEKWWDDAGHYVGGVVKMTYTQRKQLAWDAFFASANPAAPTKQEG
ncbi:hypothetical protein [Agrobacterium tumefaciens]|uniref:hypothetical protein n=1 Tax=Agrobacterium tumefaciens TaxID=358 RepID=UPI0021D3A19D|nr:hypothetical protein [Agrobacterium tumefaciens]UXS01138.1 hypothetical protein FY156_06345 [Agrobacterium tumefaciens]